jgi:hypothetical protein
MTLAAVDFAGSCGSLGSPELIGIRDPETGVVIVIDGNALRSDAPPVRRCQYMSFPFFALAAGASQLSCIPLLLLVEGVITSFLPAFSFPLLSPPFIRTPPSYPLAHAGSVPLAFLGPLGP